jgi:hypothetical protein
MASRWIKTVILSAGGLLLAAALLRFLIATSSAQALALPDPVLGIPVRWAVLLAGIVELAAAWFCLFGRSRWLQVGVLVWLATNLVVFHAGLVWLKVHPQGTFLGSLTDPLQLAGTPTGGVVRWLPLSFVFASYAAALGLWRESRRGDLLKLSCPACGGHIKFAPANVGQRIPCPHCRKDIALRQPEDLKMTCFFCQGHIVFPTHALGTKMPCPHCQKDITLIEPK